MSTVFTKNFDEPQFNRKEILRYAGSGEDAADILSLIDECIEECKNVFTYRVCFAEFEISATENEVKFPFMTAKSKALSKNLSGCQSAIVFSATVGIGIDRLIAKYGRISPAKAVIFQAIGAERIESLCDVFCEEMKLEKKGFLLPRFSPGYGDFSLENQLNIFRTLDCAKKIGLSLNESLLMSPSKSVTAIIGISDIPQNCGGGCRMCDKIDCDFRRIDK